MHLENKIDSISKKPYNREKTTKLYWHSSLAHC